MNKIAVFIGNSNETIDFDTSGMIKVFLKKDNEWDCVQEIPLVLNESMALKVARENLIQASKLIKECKIIVGKKVYGISYNVFETMGYSIWEYEGQPQAFLDEILEQELEYMAQEANRLKDIPEEKSYIKQISEGHYFIDMQEMQLVNKNISSKQILMPFLKQGEFKILEIICTHVPPWIECEIEKSQLVMKVEKLEFEKDRITLINIKAHIEGVV